MPRLCAALVIVAFAVAFPLTALMIRLGHRWRALDAPGVEGQVKRPARGVPNTGGVAVFWAIAGPILAGVAWLSGLDAGESAAWREEPGLIPADLHEHVAGIVRRTPEALALTGALLAVHVLGLIDDRRPLRPMPKLLVILGASLGLILYTDTRLLTMVDAYAGGAWLSVLVTLLWFGAVTNAMNFIDNMDGLCAGVAAVAASCFLAGAIINEQWFVAACLALLVGACAGFLAFNAPGLPTSGRDGRARIFLGDSGSLVIGMLLAFLTVRATYAGIAPGGGQAGGLGAGETGFPARAGPWYALFMPLIVLAIPLYDLVSVTIIRLRQGKSPFVGDLQHLSHRLVARGLSERAAVAVIVGCTAVTGFSGIILASLEAWQAVLVGVQTAIILLVLAMFEYASAPSRRGPASSGPGGAPDP